VRVLADFGDRPATAPGARFALVGPSFSPGWPGACRRSPQAVNFQPLEFMALRADGSSGWMRSLLRRRK